MPGLADAAPVPLAAPVTECVVPLATPATAMLKVIQSTVVTPDATPVRVPVAPDATVSVAKAIVEFDVAATADETSTCSVCPPGGAHVAALPFGRIRPP